ncbi:MAG: hypothetical protein IH949_07685 [Bacteroidetes bacterium]|nr:hypothetical protein [Bacteroidota bacterium]
MKLLNKSVMLVFASVSIFGLSSTNAQAKNFNSSKSNTSAIAYSPDVISKEKGKKIVADIDKFVNINRIKQILRKNGIKGIKKIYIKVEVLLLTNPADKSWAQKALKKGKYEQKKHYPSKPNN